MNIKKTINFKELRDKGINAVDVVNDEVIQLKGKTQILCVVTQEFLLELLNNKKNDLDNFQFNLQGAALSNHTNSFASRNTKISSLLQTNNTNKTIEERLEQLEKDVKLLKGNKNGN